MNKSCENCGENFVVQDEDLKFLKRVSPVIKGTQYEIPPPTHCPECRLVRRLAWKNEHKLYKRTCDLCNESIISIYSLDKPYKVYCPDCWWSDKWDAMDYGRDYDFNRPFFEQFNEFIAEVPKQALHQNNNYENCEYTTSTGNNRNCYLISSAAYNEDCYYGMFLPRNKNCVNCMHVMDSELLYECIDCDHGYNLAWCQNTKTCSDSKFIYDCHGCSNCFFSFGLRNKKYVFMNEQLTKEEYENRMKEIDFTSYKKVNKLKTEFREFLKGAPRLYFDGQNNEDVAASDHIFNSKNCYYCFDSNNLEDCKFCGWYNDSKDSYDVYAFGYGNELCYESLEVGTNANRILMSMHCWDSVSDQTYCLACHTSSDLLACAGLKRKKYCIFNKQYSQEEYSDLMAKIIKHMQSTGEWGQFFPLTISHFAYNETIAMNFFPKTKEEVEKKDWKWKEEEDNLYKLDKVKLASDLPDQTDDIPDDIVDYVLKCEFTGRPFKILSQELKFYKRNRLSAPHTHPDERIKLHFQNRNPRKIWQRECSKCGEGIQTSYSPEKPEKVYCEKCYLEIVY